MCVCPTQTSLILISFSLRLFQAPGGAGGQRSKKRAGTILGKGGHKLCEREEASQLPGFGLLLPLLLLIKGGTISARQEEEEERKKGGGGDPHTSHAHSVTHSGIRLPLRANAAMSSEHRKKGGREGKERKMGMEGEEGEMSAEDE